MSLPPSPMWRRWYRFLNSKVETSSLPRRQRIQVEFLIPAKGTDVSSRQWEKSIAIKASCHTPGRKRTAPETHNFCQEFRCLLHFLYGFSKGSYWHVGDKLHLGC